MLSKMGFITSCGCVNTTVWLHHLGAHEMHGEKAGWKPCKNATSYFEHILEAACHKTVAQSLYWPITSQLSNHPSKMDKTFRTLLGEIKMNS